MALIEIDGGELERLRTELASAKPSKQLLDQIGANPETRADVLRLIKKVAPNVPIPEIDAAAPILARIDALEKQLVEERKQRTDEREASDKSARERTIESEIAKGRRQLRDNGWNAEGIDKVEKLMQERGLADYDAAAALFEKSQPKEDTILPASFGASRDFPLVDDSDDAKLLVRDKNSWKAWQRKEIGKWFRDRASGSVRF